MSRLQAGGLALVVGGLESNLGKVVKLISYVGGINNPFSKSNDHWLVSGNDLVGRTPQGIIKPVKEVNAPSKYLMPLGDKQTQDELAKEKEIENA